MPPCIYPDRIRTGKRTDSRTDGRAMRSVRSPLRAGHLVPARRRSQMINTLVESVFPLARAPDELPRRRRGRKTHVSTVYRWATDGCRGAILETIQVGGTRCTSREALQRFFERLSAGRPHAGPGDAPPRPHTPSRRLRDSEAAGRELEQLGA